MTTTQQARYAPGGDIYADVERQFGRQWANRAYAASLYDDDGRTLRNVLNDARQAARGADMARPGSDSTWENLADQLYNDPFDAPLDQAGDIVRRTLESGQDQFKKAASTWLFWLLLVGGVIGIVLYVGGVTGLKKLLK